MKTRTEAEIEVVAEFAQLIEDKCDEELSDLQDLGGNEDEGIEFYADEAWLVSHVRDLGKMMTLVALYRVAEHGVISLLRTQLPEREVRQRELYRFDRLRKFLKEEHGVKLSAIDGFTAVDRLRRANNAAKHELEPGATTRAQTRGEREDIINEAQQGVPRFLASLSAALAG